MTAPVRIQRRRAKGWRMPENTVNVTRPGKWGNPFDFRSSECCWLALSYGCRADPAGRQEASVKAFAEWVEPPDKGKKTVRVERGVSFGNDKQQFQIGPRFIVGPPPTIKDIQRGLRGKNLACFCPLDKPCHADVLLELANAPCSAQINQAVPEGAGPFSVPSSLKRGSPSIVSKAASLMVDGDNFNGDYPLR